MVCHGEVNRCHWKVGDRVLAESSVAAGVCPKMGAYLQIAIIIIS